MFEQGSESGELRFSSRIIFLLTGSSLEEMQPGYSTLRQMYGLGYPRLPLHLGKEEGSREYLTNGSGMHSLSVSYCEPQSQGALSDGILLRTGRRKV